MKVGRMTYAEFVAFVATLSITIAVAIDVMLPAFDEIKDSFGLEPESNSIALTVSVYFIGLAGMQLLYGPLADHFGRKPVLYVGLFIYAVGAAASTFAPNLEILLVARFVWGVGAASPRVLSITLVRDAFQGDRMARVMSLVMTVFLLGPIVAPLIGEGVLQLGSWRYVFAVSLLFAVGALVWSTRLEETLDPANRLPLGFTRTRQAFRAVLTTRVTLWYTLAMTFVFGILLTLLASLALVFDTVYDRSGQFAVLFSLTSVFSAGAAFTNSRLVERIGSGTVTRAAGLAMVAMGGAITVLSIIGEGRPMFWLWFAMVTLIFALLSVIIPTGNSLAMEPMGHLAGTASAVLGTLSMGGGTLLGALVDLSLESSVTPMSVGFLLYSSAAMVCILMARRAAATSPSATA